MKVIFVTIAYPRDLSESNLYSDLMLEFAEHGHEVVVVCSVEKRFNKETILEEANGIKVLRVKTGNFTENSNYILKGLALLRFQSLMIEAISVFFPDTTFDLLLFSTPPINYKRIIKHIKDKCNPHTYLLLKDIFPQNALDLGILKKWNPVYWYFRKQERDTYELSDHIGCMSPANVKYLLEQNPYLSSKKIEVCANSLKDRDNLNEQKRIMIRAKIRKIFSLGEDDLLLIYGGNLGVSQGLSFLLEIFKAYYKFKNVKFLIVGEGTWYSRIEKFVSEGNYKNVILHKRVSPEEFKDMLIASDIGLIFLNPKFTIPNFPSRLTSYLEIGLPVIACTDTVSDVGDVVSEAGCGFKVISGDIQKFDTAIRNLIDSPGILTLKSVNARKLFEKSYTTEKTYTIIMNKIKK